MDDNPLTWIANLAGDAAWPLMLVVVGGLFVSRGTAPRLGGLRLIGGAMIVWGVTDVLGGPLQSRVVLGMLEDAVGRSLAESWLAVVRAVGDAIAAVCFGVGLVGALGIVTALTER